MVQTIFCKLFHLGCRYLRTMNWTGGTLQRSRNAKSSLAMSQKRHFAKARSKSHNKPQSSIEYDFSIFRPSARISQIAQSQRTEAYDWRENSHVSHNIATEHQGSNGTSYLTVAGVYNHCLPSTHTSLREVKPDVKTYCDEITATSSIMQKNNLKRIPRHTLKKSTGSYRTPEKKEVRPPTDETMTTMRERLLQVRDWCGLEDIALSNVMNRDAAETQFSGSKTYSPHLNKEDQIHEKATSSICSFSDSKASCSSLSPNKSNTKKRLFASIEDRPEMWDCNFLTRRNASQPADQMLFDEKSLQASLGDQQSVSGVQDATTQGVELPRADVPTIPHMIPETDTNKKINERGDHPDLAMSGKMREFGFSQEGELELESGFRQIAFQVDDVPGLHISFKYSPNVGSSSLNNVEENFESLESTYTNSTSSTFRGFTSSEFSNHHVISRHPKRPLSSINSLLFDKISCKKKAPNYLSLPFSNVNPIDDRGFEGESVAFSQNNKLLDKFIEEKTSNNQTTKEILISQSLGCLETNETAQEICERSIQEPFAKIKDEEKVWRDFVFASENESELLNGWSEEPKLQSSQAIKALGSEASNLEDNGMKSNFDDSATVTSSSTDELCRIPGKRNKPVITFRKPPRYTGTYYRYSRSHLRNQKGNADRNAIKNSGTFMKSKTRRTLRLGSAKEEADEIEDE